MTPYTLSAPLDGRTPLILASPHSGRRIPHALLAALALPEAQLRRIEDAHVDRLLDAAARATASPLIAATHSRVVIDLNRSECEHDPALLAAPIAIRPRLTDRVARGYGLFPRMAGPGLPIHRRPLSPIDAMDRIVRLHRPWHRALAGGLDAAVAAHGAALLLDMHSMPPLDGPAAPDLVLGDRHGASAAPEIVDWLHQRFAAAGLRVARNHPYAGGHTTAHHGRPAAGRHAVQLEFARHLYMDPATQARHSGFARLAALIAATLAPLPALVRMLGAGDAMPDAAE